MKRFSKGTLIAAIVLLTSCGNDRSSTSDSTNSSIMTADSASGHSTVIADTGVHMSDNTGNMGSVNTPIDLSGTQGSSNFANHAANGGMMEVELAKVAQQKASSKEVKSLAKMIQDDHTNANNELKKIAGTKNMTLSSALSSDHRSHLDQMNKLSGANFDKSYVEMMVQDHTREIEMFRQASTTLADTALKAFAAKTLPVLEKHLEKSRQIQKTLGTATGANQ